MPVSPSPSLSLGRLVSDAESVSGMESLPLAVTPSRRVSLPVKHSLRQTLRVANGRAPTASLPVPVATWIWILALPAVTSMMILQRPGAGLICDLYLCCLRTAVGLPSCPCTRPIMYPGSGPIIARLHYDSQPEVERNLLFFKHVAFFFSEANCQCTCPESIQLEIPQLSRRFSASS